MRRNTFPKPIADQIRSHLHFYVTPRVVGHWRRLAQALSRHPERFCFYHPDYDEFDLHMEEKVMAFLDRIGYDPRLTEAEHTSRAECLLWKFWEANVHLSRWRTRVLPLSLEQQQEERGDNALQNARDLQGRTGENGAAWFDNGWRTWLFQALLNAGWPEFKVKVILMQVFEDYDYATLSAYLEDIWHLSVKPTAIRKWVSRDLKEVGRRLLAEHEVYKEEHQKEHQKEHTKPEISIRSARMSQNVPHSHSYTIAKENHVAAENTLSSGGRSACRSVSACPGPAGARPRLDRGDRSGLFQRGP